MSNYQLYIETTDKVHNLVLSPLEHKYLNVQYIKIVLVYLSLMLLSTFILLIDEFDYRYTPVLCMECIFGVALCFNLIIVPKAYRFKGYAIREYDITYRSGIVFPSIVTVPFCKIQQVSIRQNPITRLFGLYAVDLVNGAQNLDSIRIPGLTEENAHRIKTLVIERTHHETK